MLTVVVTSVSLTFHNEHVAVRKLCNPGAANGEAKRNQIRFQQIRGVCVVAAVSCRMMLQLEELVSQLEQWSVGRVLSSWNWQDFLLWS